MEGKSRKRNRRKQGQKNGRSVALCVLAVAVLGVFVAYLGAYPKKGAGIDPAVLSTARAAEGTVLAAGNADLSDEGAELSDRGADPSYGGADIADRQEDVRIMIRTGEDGDAGTSIRVGNGTAVSAQTDRDGEDGTAGLEGGAAPGDDGQEETITLAFAGDVLLSDHVLNAYQGGGGISGVVGDSLLQAADEADLFMVNQEFPFSNRGTAAPDKQFTFRLPPEKVSLLQEMGIDLVTLANNHALDFGTEALLDTCATLEEAKIPYVGAGEDLERAKALYTTQLGRWTVGFLGATRVIPVADWAATPYGPGMLSTYDPTILLEEIQKAKETCDLVVVYVHWGIEREEYPEDYQRQLGRQYLDAGADLVIGSHPHVLQGIEYYNGKPIVYSLGNFVFGSSIPRTVLLRARWNGEEMRLSVLPATSSAGYTRELTDPAGTLALFRYLEDISTGIRIDEEGDIYPR